MTLPSPLQPSTLSVFVLVKPLAVVIGTYVPLLFLTLTSVQFICE